MYVIYLYMTGFLPGLLNILVIVKHLPQMQRKPEHKNHTMQSLVCWCRHNHVDKYMRYCFYHVTVARSRYKK